MNSPISIMGGKSNIADFIISKFPADYKSLHYIEPFFGGGCVFFAKQPSVCESINDIDELVINLWKCLQDDEITLVLKKYMDSFIWCENLFNESKKTLSVPMPNKEKETMVKYAKAYLQRNYCSFVGTGHSFGFVKKEGKRIARAYKKGELFAGANARFRRVQIFNRKAEKLISLLTIKKLCFIVIPLIHRRGKTHTLFLLLTMTLRPFLVFY